MFHLNHVCSNESSGQKLTLYSTGQLANLAIRWIIYRRRKKEKKEEKKKEDKKEDKKDDKKGEKRQTNQE